MGFLGGFINPVEALAKTPSLGDDSDFWWSSTDKVDSYKYKKCEGHVYNHLADGPGMWDSYKNSASTHTVVRRLPNGNVNQCLSGIVSFDMHAKDANGGRAVPENSLYFVNSKRWLSSAAMEGRVDTYVADSGRDFTFKYVSRTSNADIWNHCYRWAGVSKANDFTPQKVSGWCMVRKNGAHIYPHGVLAADYKGAAYFARSALPELGLRVRNCAVDVTGKACDALIRIIPFRFGVDRRESPKGTAKFSAAYLTSTEPGHPASGRTAQAAWNNLDYATCLVWHDVNGATRLEALQNFYANAYPGSWWQGWQLEIQMFIVQSGRGSISSDGQNILIRDVANWPAYGSIGFTFEDIDQADWLNRDEDHDGYEDNLKFTESAGFGVATGAPIEWWYEAPRADPNRYAWNWTRVRRTSTSPVSGGSSHMLWHRATEATYEYEGWNEESPDRYFLSKSYSSFAAVIRQASTAPIPQPLYMGWAGANAETHFFVGSDLPEFGRLVVRKQDVAGIVDQGDADTSKDIVFRLWREEGGVRTAFWANGTYYDTGELTFRLNDDATCTFDRLECGTYRIQEVIPPLGYTLGANPMQTITVGQYVGTEATRTSVTFRNEVIHANVSVQKVDADTGEALALGAGSLRSVKVGCWNKSKNAVAWNGKTVAPGALMGEASPDEQGVISFANLPYGTYQFKETAAGAGYLLNDAWSETVQVRENKKLYRCSALANSVFKGGIRIQKVDSDQAIARLSNKHSVDLDWDSAQGNGTLEGAVFKVFAIGNTYLADGTPVAGAASIGDIDPKGSRGLICTLTTNSAGQAASSADALVYGNYAIFEVEAPEGYQLNPVFAQGVPFSVTKDKEMVSFVGNEGMLL